MSLACTRKLFQWSELFTGSGRLFQADRPATAKAVVRAADFAQRNADVWLDSGNSIANEQ